MEKRKMFVTAKCHSNALAPPPYEVLFLAPPLWCNGHMRKTIGCMEIGDILKYYRVRLGDTLEEVAFRAGTDAGNLSRIERGLQQPSVKVLRSITNALNVRLSAVLGKIGDQFEVAEHAIAWCRSTVQVLRILQAISPTEREVILRIGRVVAEQNKGS